jgi:hypothetical protein
MLCLDGHWLDGGDGAGADCWLSVVHLREGLEFKFSRSLERFACLGCRIVGCKCLQGYEAKDRGRTLCTANSSRLENKEQRVQR